jgi:hypothetical protein
MIRNKYVLVLALALEANETNEMDEWLGRINAERHFSLNAASHGGPRNAPHLH